MAAGMGSRYGGLKQLDPMGPCGQTIMDYSIYDAVRAGFEKLVFVIRREMEEPFRKLIGSRFEEKMSVQYVYQEICRLPRGFAVNTCRQKPWGTGHAVLSAKDAIHEPCAVINADDFYGRRSYEMLAAHLTSNPGRHAMVGFVLNNTLSDFGPVARGICETTQNSLLESVTELTRIERDGPAAKHVDAAGNVHRLSGHETVSMNMWGFHPRFFDHLEHDFAAFLEKNILDEKAEFYVPATVNNYIKSSGDRFRVFCTPDSWFGVTYREDRDRVSQSIRHLIEVGDYPEKLWS